MIRHRQTKSNNELQSEFRRHLRFWLAGELDLTEQMRTPPRPRSSRLRAIARSAAKRPRAAASSTRRSSTACLRARCASFSRG